MSKIVWYSNAPTAPTGYGSQTRQVVTRLRDAGHDVHVVSNYGHGSGTGIQAWEGIPVWPQGTTQYSTDTLDAIIAAVNPDFVVTLYDVWPLRGVTFAGKPTLHWTPVDHDPVVPEVIEFLTDSGKGVRPTIAMSEFGQRALADMGIPSVFIPHAIEDVFQPRDNHEQRAEMSVPDDAFLIGIVAANIGVNPPRKMWVENLQAAAEMMRRHPNVYLYLHTDTKRPNGVNLEYWMQMAGVDLARVRAVDPLSYRVGTTTDEQMSYLYSALDVQLLCSGGEGFGIPVIEGMACGVPAIVTDYSAQPELVRDTGWKVGYQKMADLGQGSWLAVPRIPEIVDALEAAYAERSTDAAVARSEAAIAVAEEYAADAVFESGWVPLIQKMELAIQRATADSHGIQLPKGAGQLVGPDGNPINTAIRPNRQQRRAKKGRK